MQKGSGQMNLLVTDCTGVWEISPFGKRPIPCEASNPSHPCAAWGLMAVSENGARECLCLSRRGNVISRMPCAPGMNAMAFSECGRYLYQLSADADSIHTRLTATGELLYAAPAGIFPRMMTVRGKHLIVAGGAVNEAYIFSAPDLHCERTIGLRHPCFAADEWRDGLVLVCATEGEDIHTAVYTLRQRGVRPRLLLELPGMPGALCVCPEKICALLSTADGLMKIDLRNGTVLWNRPEWALSMKLECSGMQVLLSDTLSGNVTALHQNFPWEQKTLFRGAQAQACFLS